MNIPNILTMLRIILVPVYLHLFYSTGERGLVYAGAVFIIGGITDVLDGYVARKYDQITNLGAVLDPLADKLMTFAVLISFTRVHLIPYWVLLIIGLKEVIMIIGGLILYLFKDNQVLPSNKFGKMATLSFYTSILSVIFKLPFTIVKILFTITVMLNIVAFLNYLIIYLHMQDKKT